MILYPGCFSLRKGIGAGKHLFSKNDILQGIIVDSYYIKVLFFRDFQYRKRVIKGKDKSGIWFE